MSSRNPCAEPGRRDRLAGDIQLVPLQREAIQNLVEFRLRDPGLRRVNVAGPLRLVGDSASELPALVEILFVEDRKDDGLAELEGAS
jgi:hypothetical protein